MTTSITELSSADIDELCDEGAVEGQFLDFKENLSGRGESAKAWNDGADTIPPRAAIELARSLVAFANAEGGWIVLGIREGGGAPSRAAEIAPLRACHELARRLRQSITSRIDPQPTGLEVWGVETDEEGAGVVVLRMPASPYAPHGVIVERAIECYVRRNDECRLMTMRDIQERTLEINRGLAALETTLVEQRQAFIDLAIIQKDGSPDLRPRMGYYIVALPVRSRFDLERIYAGNWLQRCLVNRFLDTADRKRSFELYSHLPQLGPLRPVLRGGTTTFNGSGYTRSLAIYSAGGVSAFWKDAEHSQGVFVDWVIADVVNILKIVDDVRKAAGHADCDYAIEVGLSRNSHISDGPGMPFRLARLGARNFGDDDRECPAIRLPLWPVGSAGSFGDVAIGVLNDLSNAAGWLHVEGLTLRPDSN